MIVIGSGSAGKRAAFQATRLNNSDLEKINFWLLVNKPSINSWINICSLRQAGPSSPILPIDWPSLALWARRMHWALPANGALIWTAVTSHLNDSELIRGSLEYGQARFWWLQGQGLLAPQVLADVDKPRYITDDCPISLP